MPSDLLTIGEYLEDFRKHASRDSGLEEIFKESLKSSKEYANKNGDQLQAKQIWCLETIIATQGNYITAFRQMKQKQFYEGWVTLERVEIDLNSIKVHLPKADWGLYKLEFIEAQTKKFQSLFPYKMFLSPGMFVKEKKCSICGNTISLRHPCEHKKGQIYNGEMCVHEITEIDVLEVSVVTDPVQKYSVAFLKREGDEKDDHYDYSLVEYVIKGLNHPFVDWNVAWTKRRHPHSLFPDIKETDNCPCDSGKLYKDCCLRENGILRPHAQITFGEIPLAELPNIVFPTYGKRE